MKKLKITFDKMTQDVVGKVVKFPKYTTQIMNLANQNAHGTRPNVVGQLSELIKDYEGDNYQEWVEWYLEYMPNTIDKATEKVYEQVLNLKEAINLIDKKMVRDWVEDLVLTKTFVGFCFQESILKRIATDKKTTYRLATPSEESKGIDGYIGEIPVSIKPKTYRTKDMLPETIPVKIIYYEKIEKKGIYVYYDL